MAIGSAAVVNTVAPAPNRNTPEIPDRNAAASATRPSCTASTLLAQTTRRSPSTVKPSKLRPRLISVTLSSRSSFAMDADNAGWET